MVGPRSVHWIQETCVEGCVKEVHARQLTVLELLFEGQLVEFYLPNPIQLSGAR